MPDADVITLPVIRIDRGEFLPGLDYDRTNVTDINVFRYVRDRRAMERREMSSLLSEGREG